MTQVVKRRPAKNHIKVIDNLHLAINESGVPKTVVKELIGIEYITLDKYLRKERNINDDTIAKRMVVTTNLLNKLVKKGILPIANETNIRLRKSVILKKIDEYLTKTKQG